MECCVTVWICSYLFKSKIFSAGRSQRYSRRSVVYAIRYPSDFRLSEFWIRRSSAALGAPSVFGFRKNMPTKMTLWTRVIYTSWDWGWKSIDTLGSRLLFHTRRSQSMRAKAYGSVLFSASNLNLFMGFCRKDIWIRTDWLSIMKPMFERFMEWNACLLHRFRKDLHNRTCDGSP